MLSIVGGSGCLDNVDYVGGLYWGGLQAELQTHDDGSDQRREERSTYREPFMQRVS